MLTHVSLRGLWVLLKRLLRTTPAKASWRASFESGLGVRVRRPLLTLGPLPGLLM